MRITSISSSFAAVVDHVIRSVAVAGFAVRTLLHLTLKREPTGNWLALCQPGCPCGGNQFGFQCIGHPMPGYQPGGCTMAIAVFPAARRLVPCPVDRRS